MGLLSNPQLQESLIIFQVQLWLIFWGVLKIIEQHHAQGGHEVTIDKVPGRY
jgi:hypothetical protein